MKPPKTNLEDALDSLLYMFEQNCMRIREAAMPSDVLLASMTHQMETARTQITNLFVSQFLEIVGEDDIVEFGDPLLSPTTASQDARSRDRLRAELRTQIKDTIEGMR